MTRIAGSTSYHNEFRRPTPFSPIPSSSKDPIDEDYWSSSIPSSTTASATQLQKARLEDQPWYHGKIKRINAINLLKYNGDFLVRDSISNPGDYVLTGLCRDEPMHFEIHRAPSSDPKIDLYYFEDEQFRSVVDLIQFYLNHRRQVTTKSQFILRNPITNFDKFDSSAFNKFQMEIEATYAPFINKHGLPSAPRYDRSLSQKAIINQAKKRLNGSEHDLMHLLNLPASSSSSLSSSKSFGYLNRTSESDSYKNGIKVTSFGVDENDGFCVEKTILSPSLPPQSSRPVPKFPPPKSPIAFPEDLDDYDDVDYEAMEEEQSRLSSENSPIIPLIRSPPAIPPKPLSLLKQKRNSEFIDGKEAEKHYLPSDPNRKHSAHSLFHPSSNIEVEEKEEQSSSLLPAYLDRTQSCQNLVYRRKSAKEEEEEENFKRYPSVKIEPAPMLPARSKESLCSMSALTMTEKKSDSWDYDDIQPSKANASSDYDKIVKTEGDYDKVKPKEAKSITSSPPESSPKPKTFAQLRAISQPPKQIRHLLNYLSSLTIEKLSLMITSEDIKVFNLTNHNNNGPSDSLKRLFMAESRILREEVLDRNACLQLTVSMTIQKSVTPKDVIKVWIQTAAHLLQKIGNGFAFGAIMAVLISEKKKRIRAFMELDPSTSTHLRALTPIYEDFLAGKMPSAIAGCFLPFIQPLLHLFSVSDYVQASKLKNLNSNGLDNLEILSNLILLARHVIFENSSKLSSSVEASRISGPNPFSTESLIHCLLSTPALSTEAKESDRRKIRQMFEQSF